MVLNPNDPISENPGGARIVYNICDCILGLFFYNIVLNMINFWEQLYFEHIASQMDEEADPERYDILE